MKITHLSGLRAFEATLRKGNFRAAALELGVTPAAVGQQIRKLEHYLGRKLFTRSNAGVTPTDESQQIKARLTSSFSVIDDIMVQLSNRRLENRVAVTMPQSFAQNWLTPHLADFYRLNSEIDLRLDASNRLVDIISEDFDFAIRYGPESSEIYDEIPLFADYVLPVCAPAFAQQHQISMHMGTLKDVPLVHLNERTADPQWADWEQWSKQFGFHTTQMHSGLQFSHLISGLQAAIAGHGLVLCGITEAYSAINNGLLVVPFGPQQNCPTSYQYRLLSVRGRYLSKLQIQFRDWIKDAAKDFENTVDVFLSAK